MSFIDDAIAKVKGAEHTFLAWVVKVYAKFYKAEPTIQVITDEAVNYALPALEIILSATGQGALDPAISAVVSEVQTDLHTVAALVYDFGATPTAASILAAVQKDLASIASDAHIKNAAHLAILQKIITMVGALAASIVGALGQAPIAADGPGGTQPPPPTA